MGGFGRFVHVLELFYGYIQNELEMLIGKFETGSVMHLFRILMKNKKLSFVSNRYFLGGSLLSGGIVTFGIYWQALNFIVSFRVSLLSRGRHFVKLYSMLII